MTSTVKSPNAVTTLFWQLHQPMHRSWEALQAHILKVPDTEAWLFLRLLSGSYWYPRITHHALIRMAARYAALPEALLHLSTQEVGDTAEALTLALIPPGRPAVGFPEKVEQWLREDLPRLLRSEERLLGGLEHLWQTLSPEEAFFLHKVLLHSAHLPALRYPTPGPGKGSRLASLLRVRWPAFPEESLLAHLRTHITPPTTPTQPTLF